jgi:hypothetical protein
MVLQLSLLVLLVDLVDGIPCSPQVSGRGRPPAYSMNRNRLTGSPPWRTRWVPLPPRDHPDAAFPVINVRQRQAFRFGSRSCSDRTLADTLLRLSREQLVAGAEAGPLAGGLGQDGELLAQGQVLGDQVGATP